MEKKVFRLGYVECQLQSRQAVHVERLLRGCRVRPRAWTDVRMCCLPAQSAGLKRNETGEEDNGEGEKGEENFSRQKTETIIE